MSRLAVNVVANLVGQGWPVLISLVVVPLYLKLLGIEAYGLIGFYFMLQGLAQVLDLGLSPTMNREMARYSAQPGRPLSASSHMMYSCCGQAAPKPHAMLRPSRVCW